MSPTRRAKGEGCAVQGNDIRTHLHPEVKKELANMFAFFE